jgi:starch-binding outer membrane protein, SusD/RagB family
MKYTKYLAILAAAFMMGSCSDDFLDKEPSENASEDQIKDLLDKDPTAIQAYITGYYKNMFSPKSTPNHFLRMSSSEIFSYKSLEIIL